MAKIAVIETGGKQYIVSQDSVLEIEKLSRGENANGAVTFDKVLLVDDGVDTKVGTPYIAGATIAAGRVEDGREKKITVIRYRQKSRYFKKKGRRQSFSKVRIISLP